jgi:glycosyltransferase involved in cell wall biosynthesis
MTGGASKPSVMIATDVFPPCNYGGAVRALAAVTAATAGQLNIRVLTRDHHIITGERLPDVPSDIWTRRDGIEVFYASPGTVRTWRILKAAAAAEADTIFVNSLFSTLAQWLLWSRRFGRFGKERFIIAPEGELSMGALEIKRRKKLSYLAFARISGLYRDVEWKAVSDIEAGDILRHFREARCTILPHFAGPGMTGGLPPRKADKASHAMKLLFASRISPKKNLPYLLRLLAAFKAPVQLSIVGRAEDMDHWAYCRTLIEALPAAIAVRIVGEEAPDQMDRHYLEADAFVLPTLGENYGFVIEDALRCGCPVLISDQTPWTDRIKAGGGFAIPLAEPKVWLEALTQVHAMDESAHRHLRDMARAVWDKAMDSAASTSDYIRFLSAGVAGSASEPRRETISGA